MPGSTHLTTWVSAEIKQRFGALADQLGLSESALLKRLVDLNLQSTRLAEITIGPRRRSAARRVCMCGCGRRIT